MAKPDMPKRQLRWDGYVFHNASLIWTDRRRFSPSSNMSAV